MLTLKAASGFFPALRKVIFLFDVTEQGRTDFQEAEFPPEQLDLSKMTDAYEQLNLLVRHSATLMQSVNGVETEVDITPLIDNNYSTDIILECDDPDGCELAFEFEFNAGVEANTLMLMAPEFKNPDFWSPIDEIILINFYRREFPLDILPSVS